MAENDRFVALAFCRADLLFELDEDFRVIFAAGAGIPLLGVVAEALRGRQFLELIAPADRRLAHELLSAGRSRGRLDDVVIRLAGTSNATPPVALGGYRVPDFDDHLFLALKSNPVCQIDRPQDTDLKRDPDSGLLDEASFTGVAADRAQALQRAGGRPQVTMVKIDRMDDLLKHLGTSDRKKLCNTVGEILNDASLGGNTAGRVAGDAFSYVHSEEIEPDQINSRIAEAAKRLFKTNLDPKAHTLDADGAGMSEQQVAKAIAHTIRQFCEQGDIHKKKSLSQVLRGMVSETIDSVAFIRKVIEKRDFDVVFMPVCDMRHERVLHFEALTRFRDAKAGTSPYHLFCLAEEIGIIADLDLAVCEAVVRATMAHLRKNSLMPPVAINISGQSIASLTFVGELKKLLARSGVPPKKIMFEITESARIHQIVQVNEAIQQFRQLGFRFCLDDFGSGAASFDYLNALEVDIVKFDGPVIKRACASQRGSDLLASMAKMCAGLSVRTCAEMVEDKRTAVRVQQCGVDFGQGWYFGKPEPDPMIFAERFPAN